MRINDGGNFSPDYLARLLANKKGSATEQELAESEAIPQQAIDTASGMMGTIKAPSLVGRELFQAGNIGKNIVQEGDDAVREIAKREIQKNVGQGIKQLPSEFDLEQEAFKKAAAKAPSFFDRFGPKAVDTPGERIPVEKFKQILDLLKTK